EAPEQELVVAVRALDGHAEPLLQLRGPADVVDMAVGEQDLLGRDPRFRDRGLDALEVSARVDDGGTLRGFAPDDGTVLLKEGDGDDDGADGHGTRKVRGRSRPSTRSAPDDNAQLIRPPRPAGSSWQRRSCSSAGPSALARRRRRGRDGRRSASNAPRSAS